MAAALLDAAWPVLVVEGVGHAPDGSAALQTLDELMDIPVCELGSTWNVANRQALNLTGAHVEVLKDAYLVLTVGAG